MNDCPNQEFFEGFIIWDVWSLLYLSQSTAFNDYSISELVCQYSKRKVNICPQQIGVQTQILAGTNKNPNWMQIFKRLHLRLQMNCPWLFLWLLCAACNKIMCSQKEHLRENYGNRCIFFTKRTNRKIPRKRNNSLFPLRLLKVTNHINGSIQNQHPPSWKPS